MRQYEFKLNIIKSPETRNITIITEHQKFLIRKK